MAPILPQGALSLIGHEGTREAIGGEKGADAPRCV